IGSLQGVQGALELAGTVLAHAKGNLIRAIFRSQPTSRFRLAKGEAVLESVEVRLAEDSPARLVIALRIGLFLVALYKAQGHLPRRRGHQRQAEVVNDIALQRGLEKRQASRPSASRSAAAGVQSRASQILTVPSPPAEASSAPSGLNATLWTWL